MKCYSTTESGFGLAQDLLNADEHQTKPTCSPGTQKVMSLLPHSTDLPASVGQLRVLQLFACASF